MSEKLGFTFYPKDWWTSDSYYDLTATERYLYLECLFTMYSNDGYLNYNKKQMERRFAMTITDEEFENVISRFEHDSNGYTSITVNKRLKKAITNRENGKKGGAPKGNNNAQKQPKQPTKTTQNNPPSERERETELKENINNEDFDNDNKIIFDYETGIKPVDDFHAAQIKTIRQHYDEFMTKDSTQKELMAMDKKLSTRQIEVGCMGFVQSLITKGHTMEDIYPKFKEHFRNWFNKYGANNLKEVPKERIEAEFRKFKKYEYAQ